MKKESRLTWQALHDISYLDDPDFIEALDELDEEFPGASLDDPSLVDCLLKHYDKYELGIKIIEYVFLFLIAPSLIFFSLFFIAKLLNNLPEFSIGFDIYFFINTLLVSFVPSTLLWYVIRDVYI